MKKYLYVLGAYLYIAYKIYWVNYFRTKNLIKEFSLIYTKGGRNFNPEVIKRFSLYAKQTELLTTWFATLRGYKLSEKEQKATFYYGTLMAIFDDFSDNLKISSSEIIQQITKEVNSNFTGEQYLAKHIFLYLKDNCSREFYNFSTNALQAQDSSIAQTENTFLSFEELKTITFKKGATSTLVYRYILDHPFVENEKEAISELGFLAQFANDLFDVYKDKIEDQQTLVTNTTDFQIIEKELNHHLKKCTSYILNLNYEVKNKQKLLIQFSTISSRIKVCSDQLKELQKNTNNIFKLDNYTRKELICDMEKPKNIMKSYLYSVELYKKINSKK